MMKIIQWKASREASLLELAQEYLLQNFPQHKVFAQEALSEPDLHCYVSERRADLSMRRVKAKAPILMCLKPKSPNLMNGVLAPESVLFEDDGLIAVNKPPGLPSQSTFKAWEDNLFHQIIGHRLRAHGFPAHLPYLGMHHRLDRDTSGLLVFTTKPSKNKEMADLFKLRKIKKNYLAIVEGEIPGAFWKNALDVRKGKHPKHKFYFVADEKKGETALSVFSRLQSFSGDRHLIRCSLKTGRTHQLRVHLKADGLGIVGDRVYGVHGKENPMRLHAHSLKFLWNQKEVALQAEPNWPEDIHLDGE